MAGPISVPLLSSEITFQIPSGQPGGIPASQLRSVLQDMNAQREFVVTPFMFGAIGDGIADDTVALQNALTYIQTNSGYVSLGGGSFKFTSGLTLFRMSPFSGGGIMGPGTLIPSPSMTGDAITIEDISSGRPYQTWIRFCTFDITANTGLTSVISLPGATDVDISFNAFKNDGASTTTFAIASGTYNSGTGLVTLTLGSSAPFTPGMRIWITDSVAGTGSWARINGTHVAGAATTGTTLTYTIEPGLTMTIAAGGTAQQSLWGSKFAAIVIRPRTPGNDNTNSFWTTIHRNTFMPFSGGAPWMPYGILTYGEANALQITSNNFVSVDIAVSGQAESILGTSSNDVHIRDNWFEGVTTCVENVAGSNGFCFGWIISQNRLESVSTFVSLTAVSGTPAPSGLPPAIMFNVIVGASIYINNPLLTKYWSMEATSYGDSENQIGNNNVFLGAYPGLLTTGSGNTGMGAGVMPFMTTAFANTGFGDSALFSVGTAVSNSAFGYTALQSATGSQNTAIGTGALQNVSTGGNNVGIGYAAGGGITIGSNNVVIGGVTGLASGLSDSIIIGDGAGNIKIDYSKTNAGAWTVVGELITAPSATGSAGLRLTSGTAPTSPVDGDMWYDGTNVKFRVGGTTKTFTLT